MLRFLARGNIGAVRQSADQVWIAARCDFFCEHPSVPELRWAVFGTRDPKLMGKITHRLRVGDLAVLEGKIGPRRRVVRGATLYTIVFVLTKFRIARRAAGRIDTGDSETLNLMLSVFAR